MDIKALKIRLMKLKLWFCGKRCNPYFFTKILQSEGISVGDHTIFYDPLSQLIDRERPWMINIGDYCKITHGAIILCHDYSRSVLRRAYGEVVGEAGVTSIGDNVFIGMNSIILMGASIGNNVIIGAGSVVSGNIPDNCVAAGNPAKVIRTLDKHMENRKEKYLQEAELFFVTYYKRYHADPTVQKMGAFFPLYLSRNIAELENSGVNLNLNGDNRCEIIRDFMKTEPVFSDFKEFANRVHKKYEL